MFGKITQSRLAWLLPKIYYTYWNLFSQSQTIYDTNLLNPQPDFQLNMVARELSFQNTVVQCSLETLHEQRSFMISVHIEPHSRINSTPTLRHWDHFCIWKRQRRKGWSLSSFHASRKATHWSPEHFEGELHMIAGWVRSVQPNLHHNFHSLGFHFQAAF